MQYNISYKNNEVYQTILVDAPSQSAAERYFQEYKPAAQFLGSKVATRDDQRPGKPLLRVPETWAAKRDETHPKDSLDDVIRKANSRKDNQEAHNEQHVRSQNQPKER